MRSSLISISVFTILLLSYSAFGQTNYETYSNARFGYQIQYPKGVLVPQEEAANGDGCVFLSKDGSAELRVWGQYNALSKSLKNSYQEALRNYGSGVSYKVLNSNGYVISGIKGKRVFYQKTLLKGDGGDTGAVHYTFTIKYRKSDKAKFDRIVRKIAGTFIVN